MVYLLIAWWFSIYDYRPDRPVGFPRRTFLRLAIGKPLVGCPQPLFFLANPPVTPENVMFFFSSQLAVVQLLHFIIKSRTPTKILLCQWNFSKQNTIFPILPKKGNRDRISFDLWGMPFGRRSTTAACVNMNRWFWRLWIGRHDIFRTPCRRVFSESFMIFVIVHQWVMNGVSLNISLTNHTNQ